ncbi:hypothetical protein B0H34DRAFT_692598, partial [Crassisporium funariophilum]
MASKKLGRSRPWLQQHPSREILLPLIFRFELWTKNLKHKISSQLFSLDDGRIEQTAGSSGQTCGHLGRRKSPTGKVYACFTVVQFGFLLLLRQSCYIIPAFIGINFVFPITSAFVLMISQAARRQGGKCFWLCTMLAWKHKNL